MLTFSWLKIVASNLCNIFQRRSRGNDEEYKLFHKNFQVKNWSHFPKEPSKSNHLLV